MAAKTIEAAPRQWAHIADAVHRRRTELGLSAKQLADRAGPGLSIAVLSLIENSRQASYTIRTMRALCRGLDWAPESIEALLAGDDPIPAGPKPALAQSDRERLASLELELADLRRRLGPPSGERNGSVSRSA